jgi:hypothetical protein
VWFFWLTSAPITRLIDGHHCQSSWPQAASTALAAVSHALGAAQGFTRATAGSGQAAAGGSGKRRKQSEGDDTPARFELSDLSGIAGLVSSARCCGH